MTFEGSNFNVDFEFVCNKEMNKIRNRDKNRKNKIK